MTSAICITCGAEKFGAFVPCPRCGYSPEQISDKAKSLMLSDHHFPPAELKKFGGIIESGGQIPYEPVSLAICAEPIFEEEYFWAHFDESKGVISCIRCASLFKPESEDVLCPGCHLESEEPVAVCGSCVAIYEQSAKYCQRCGNAVRLSTGLTANCLGTNLAIYVRRLMTTHTATKIAEMKFIPEIRAALSPAAREASEYELEAVCMYSSLLALRKFSASESLTAKIFRRVNAVYKLGFLMAGADPATADSYASAYVIRFDQYDSLIVSYPENWMLHLANEVNKNCFHVEKHMGAVMEMMVLLGLFLKVVEDLLRKEIRG
jgi:hypothetical protein